MTRARPLRLPANRQGPGVRRSSQRRNWRPTGALPQATIRSPSIPPIDGTLEFRVEEIPLEPAENCENLGDAKGFRLMRINPEAGGQTVMVHEDTSIPKSRGCPQAYRIGAVQTFHPEGGQPVFAVLIATRSFGFEGPDYRWMAVVGKL